MWYIGDNYQCDVEGARNAGLFPVLYVGATHSAQMEEEDVLTVSHWNELIDLINGNVLCIDK